MSLRVIGGAEKAPAERGLVAILLCPSVKHGGQAGWIIRKTNENPDLEYTLERLADENADLRRRVAAYERTAV